MNPGFKMVLGAVAVVAIFASGASAQLPGSNGASLVEGDTSIAALSVQEQTKSYAVELSGAPSGAFAIMLIGFAHGSWSVDFGGALGVVNMDVIQPIDFLLGITDDSGHLSATLPFIADLPTHLDGVKFFSQVVSFNYIVDSSTPQPTYIFNFVNSNVVQAQLRTLLPLPSPADEG